MDKILITGGSGLLGSNFAMAVSSIFKTYALFNAHFVSMRNVDFVKVDLTRTEELVKIAEIKPDIIVHCAALTNVEYCENHPDEAYLNNVIASAHVAEVAARLKAWLIHISTEAVFNGFKGNYREADTTDPINIYGKTKLEAEEKVLQIYSDAAVIRTTIYGWNKINKFSLAEWMLDRLRNNDKLDGFRDIYFSPILVNDLIDSLLKILKIKFRGIIHISGSENISKLDFAYKIAEVFNCDTSMIRPVDSDTLKQAAKRAKMATLNVSKAEEILKIRLPNVRDGLIRMRKLEDQGYLERFKNNA